MNSRLIDFHKKSEVELRILLESFNILFYGYGCKKDLLKDLFPDAIIFNMKFQTMADIILNIELNMGVDIGAKNIRDIDHYLSKCRKKLILILLNFDFSIIELQKLTSIRLIGTLETLNFSFVSEDIDYFNFIMRDLTTFVNYTDECFDVDVESNNLTSTIHILNGVSKNSKIVFKELLKSGNTTVSFLFNKLKAQLMIINKNKIVEYLAEFLDHGLIMIKDKIEIKLKLTKDESKELLKSPILVDV